MLAIVITYCRKQVADVSEELLSSDPAFIEFSFMNDPKGSCQSQKATLSPG